MKKYFSPSGRRALNQEADLPATLPCPWIFSLQNWEKRNSLLLKHPVRGVLLHQHEAPGTPIQADGL